jgi:hypothetical protein
MNVTGKGSTYKIEATPWNDKSHSDRYTKFKTDVSIMGKTVQEVLQTGENSLQKVLNDFQKLQVKDGTIKGFSIEGIFNYTPKQSKDEVKMQQIKDILSSIKA